VLLDDNVWRALPKAARRARNAPLLESVGESVDRAVRSGAFDDDSAVLTVSSAALDDKGRDDIAAELNKAAERIAKIGEAAAKRVGESDEPPTTIVMMAFDAREPAAAKKGRAKAKA
jgi:hypothetical protein